MTRRTQWIRRSVAGPAVGGFLALILASACRNGERLRDALDEGPIIGSALPALALTDLGGQPVDLASFRGRVVLLNLWATWCAPCREEMPELQRLQDRYETGDLMVVGVSIDDIDPGRVAEFLEANGITYTNLLADGSAIIATLGVSPGIPHTLLVDGEGTVRGYWRGRFHPFEPNNAGLLEGIIAGTL